MDIDLGATIQPTRRPYYYTRFTNIETKVLPIFSVGVGGPWLGSAVSKCPL